MSTVTTTAIQTASGPKLIVIDPGGSRSQVPITKSPFTIGRESGNDLLLRDSRISRRHALILLQDGHCRVEDCQSRHGTFVNGERVEGARELHNNDQIEFGVPGTFALLFVSEEETLRELIQRVDTPVSTQATSRELRNLNWLLEVGRSLHAGLALEDVLATVVDACINVTATERGFIFLRNQKGELELRVGRDKTRRSLQAGDFQGSLSVIQDVGKGQQDIIVTNSMADERVSQRQSVVGLDLRTIICLALRRLPTVDRLDSTMAGLLSEVLGVIYLDSRLSTQPFSDTDRQVLRSLALEAANVIENARLFNAARAKEQLDQQLAIARTIQQALLPKSFKRYRSFQVTGLVIPCLEVGGDYYDLIEMPDGRLACVVADVCGKGVAAALLTSLLQGGLAAMVEMGQPPDATARLLNRYLYQHTGTERYATFFCGMLELDGRFNCVNAGHVPPLWVGSSGEPEVLPAQGFPLGLFEEASYELHQRQFRPGDTLILHTDGLTEAENASAEAYGMERLEKAVGRNRKASAEDLSQAILQDVNQFIGKCPPADDMTLLVVRYEGNSPA